jgi:hypothetical protein
VEDLERRASTVVDLPYSHAEQNVARETASGFMVPVCPPVNTLTMVRFEVNYTSQLRFEIFTAVAMKKAVFCDVAL